MSSGQAAAADEAQDYKRLCLKYSVPGRCGRQHYEALARREAREDKARIAAANADNADNVRRYLQEATDAQFQAEMKRRGL